MHLPNLLLLFSLSVSYASPIAVLALKPAAFFLAGDSTTAINGGWGNGFLTTLTNGATGKNYGHSGATTASFIAGGDWNTVIAAVKGASSSYRPFVTIQFGHNDQKSTSGVTIAQFKTNLAKMVGDVKTAGGSPILTTSLTRRTFNITTNKVIENLAEHSAAAKEVAAANNAQLIDLNRASTDYVNALGQTDADKYDLSLDPKDRTHLNPAGEEVFGNQVANLIATSTSLSLGEQTEDWLAPDAKIVAAITAGKYILP